MDTATSDIRAIEFTPSRDGDSPVLPDLLDQIPQDEDIGTVTADGAYDTRRCHNAIIARGGTPIIPIRKNGRPWKDDCPAARARNETLRATRHYDRAFWKRWTGYHARSRAEAKMRGLKPFGERIAARDPDRQTAEIHIRVALMNRFNALDTAEIVRVPRPSRGKGKPRLRPPFCNNAVPGRDLRECAFHHSRRPRNQVRASSKIRNAGAGTPPRDPEARFTGRPPPSCGSSRWDGSATGDSAPGRGAFGRAVVYVQRLVDGHLSGAGELPGRGGVNLLEDRSRNKFDAKPKTNRRRQDP